MIHYSQQDEADLPSAAEPVASYAPEAEVEAAP